MKKNYQPKSLMDWVYILRSFVYIVAIILLIGLALIKMVHCEPTKPSAFDTFCPPDLVPHPIPPWDDPRDPKPDVTPCDNE